MSNNNESLQDLLRKLQAGVNLPKEAEDAKKQLGANLTAKASSTKAPDTIFVHNIELFQLLLLQIFLKIKKEIAGCTDDGPKFQELCRAGNKVSRILSIIHGLTAIAVHMLQKLSENLRVPVNNVDSRAVINKTTFDDMWASVKALLGDDEIGTDEDKEFVWGGLMMSVQLSSPKLDAVLEAVQRAQENGASEEELKDMLNTGVNKAIDDNSSPLPEAQKRAIKEVIDKLLNKEEE